VKKFLLLFVLLCGQSVQAGNAGRNKKLERALWVSIETARTEQAARDAKKLERLLELTRALTQHGQQGYSSDALEARHLREKAQQAKQQAAEEVARQLFNLKQNTDSAKPKDNAPAAKAANSSLWNLWSWFGSAPEQQPKNNQDRKSPENLEPTAKCQSGSVEVRRVKVLQQVGNECGYHALKNAEIMKDVLTRDANPQALNDQRVYDQFMGKNLPKIQQRRKITKFPGSIRENLQSDEMELISPEILIIENIPGVSVVEKFLQPLREFVLSQNAMLGFAWNEGANIHNPKINRVEGTGVHWIGCVAVKQDGCITIYFMNSSTGSGDNWIPNIVNFISQTPAQIDEQFLLHARENIMEGLENLLHRHSATVEDFVDKLLVSWRNYRLPDDIKNQVLHELNTRSSGMRDENMRTDAQALLDPDILVSRDVELLPFLSDEAYQQKMDQLGRRLTQLENDMNTGKAPLDYRVLHAIRKEMMRLRLSQLKQGAQ
jgi:hypothetical protein